ncbi:MAG: M24 family metallopeptidase [bacterium]
MESRLKKIRKQLTLKHINLLLITNPLNVRYLTGFTGSAGFCLIGQNVAIFFSDFRYRMQYEKEVDKSFRFVEGHNYFDLIVKEVKSRGFGRLYFEDESFNYRNFNLMKKKLGKIKFHPSSGIVDSMRIIKDKKEISFIKKAAIINSKALTELIPEIKKGVSEIELSTFLESSMKKYGSERNAFDTIVASGVRSALPHGVASTKKIKKGNLITVDFGSVVNGYHADTTRVFACGEPSKKFRKIYDIVLCAQKAAIEKVAPGVKCEEVDAEARNIIQKEGYGESFGHGTGHGLGLFIHEGPRIAPNQDTILEPNMILTIEPGIYVEGWGGVRIEDMILVTEKGKRNMTSGISKELIVC